LSLVLYL